MSTQEQRIWVKCGQINSMFWQRTLRVNTNGRWLGFGRECQWKVKFDSIWICRPRQIMMSPLLSAWVRASWRPNGPFYFWGFFWEAIAVGLYKMPFRIRCSLGISLIVIQSFNNLVTILAFRKMTSKSKHCFHPHIFTTYYLHQIPYQIPLYNISK